MKSSEEILLDEVKAGYTRQLTAWTELMNKSHNILQLNGLILTIIFIGMQFARDSFGDLKSMFLIITSVLIISSIGIILLRVVDRTIIKETDMELDEGYDIENKQKHILVSLIKTYKIAQKDIIKKYKTRSKNLIISLLCLIFAFGFLVLFLIFAYGENVMGL